MERTNRRKRNPISGSEGIIRESLKTDAMHEQQRANAKKSEPTSNIPKIISALVIK